MNRRAFLAGLLGAAVAAPALAASAKRAVLTLPGSPYMVHGVVRYRGWFGPCVTVRNPRTGVTRDIGFRDNVLDVEKLRAFLGDPPLSVGDALGYVTKWWDMTGNNRHLLQATTGNQPAISANHAIDGMPSIAFDGVPNGVALKNAKTMAVTGLSLSTQSMTCLQWVAQTSSLNLGCMWAFLDAGNAARLEMFTGGDLTSLNTPGLQTYDGATVRRSAALSPKAEGCMLGAAGSGSALVHCLDAASASYAAPVANTVTQQLLGNDGGTTLYNNASYSCNAVWATTLTAGEIEIARQNMAAAFGRGAPRVQIVIDSNSNWTDYGCTGCNGLTRYIQKLLPRPVSIINMSIFGNIATNADTHFATNIAPLRDASWSRQIYYNEQGVNEITGGAGGAATYAKVISAINKAKAAGFTQTMIAKVGNVGGEYDVFNNLAVAGEGTDFDYLLSGIFDPRIVGGEIVDGHVNSSGQLKIAQSSVQKFAAACGF